MSENNHQTSLNHYLRWFIFENIYFCRLACRPELILDFHDGFNDKSGNNLAVTPENVHIESGAARFDGSGKIRLWRFSGVSYGSQFTVTMKYKENPHSRTTEPMHLLSNCFNPEVMRPSIDIAISPNKGAMFLATTDKAGEKMAILKYNVSIHMSFVHVIVKKEDFN